MNLSALRTRLLQEVGEDPAAPAYYTSTEATDAINEAQRMFVLLTLCLEKEADLTLGSETSFYHLLTTLTDFLLPLRVRVKDPEGTKVRPGTLADFEALSSTWQTDEGPPSRYAMLGFDLLAINRRPSAGGMQLTLTYAKMPATLAADGDVPEIPEEHHPDLLKYAVPRLRRKEGGQELGKVLIMFRPFLEVAAKFGDFVRERRSAQGYDRLPFELSKWLAREERRAKGARNG